MTFTYNIAKKDNGIVLTLSGQLIEKTQAQEMSIEIDDLISTGINRIVVDMGELKYLNSSGLNVLINLLTKARNSGGDVIITNLSPKVRQLFLITRLNAVFHVADNMDTAIAQLSEP